jgi:hypothetical protein
LIVTVAAAGGEVGQVEVLGPSGFERSFGTTTTLAGLVPGTYQVRARPARAKAASWWPALPAQAALVTAGRTTRVDDAYSVEVPTTTRVVAASTLPRQPAFVHPTRREIVLLDSSAARGLRVGDILAAGIGRYTPYGLLRRVVSITPRGTDVLVDTVQATLRQALPSGSINIDIGTGHPPPRPKSSLKVDGNDMPIELASSNTPELQGIWNFNEHVGCGATGQLSVDDGFNLYPVFKLSASWSLFSGVTAASFAVGFDESAHLALHARAGLTCQWMDDSPQVPLSGPIDVQVGPVPVVVQPDWFMSSSVSGELNQDTAVGFSQSSSALLGLRYAHGRVSPIDQFHKQFAPATPQGEQANVTAAIGPKFELAVYGLAGPYVTFQLFGSATITTPVGGQKTSTASIIAGVQAGVGFKVDVLPIDWSIPNLLRLSGTIYSGPVGPTEGGGSSSEGASAALAAYLKNGPHPSVASAPATTSAGTYAIVLYPIRGDCTSCQLPATVLRYQTGTWHQVASLVLPLSSGGPGTDLAANSNSATSDDATGAPTPDFLAEYQTGVNFGEVGVVVSDVTGRWAVAQFAHGQPGTEGILEAPSITAGHVVSLEFSCNPSCAGAQQHRLEWRYESARGGFVLVSREVCGQSGQVRCP